MEEKKGKNVKNVIKNVFCGLFIFVIILLSVSGMAIQNTINETDSNIDITKTNIMERDKRIEITNLKFNEFEIELDIKETKNIILEITPEKANIEDLEFCTSNSEIVIFEKVNMENNKNGVTLKIKPIAEGNCEIFAKSVNEIESNKVALKIIDNEKIEQARKEAEEQTKKEEQARKEAEEQAKKEEQARKEAEEQAKKEEQARKEAEEQAKQKQTIQSRVTTTKKSNSSSQSNSNNTHGKAVYRTPSGKRYHFDPDCGGKNSYQTTLNEAKSSGLTPCKKCAY